MQNRKLTNLINIGKKIEKKLNEINVYNEDDLRNIGAVEAHKKIQKLYPNNNLPLCYYLYAFEGAITNTQWEQLSEEKKAELKSAIDKQ